jgi:HAD superfamily hydrolase (TIGR01490 family)
MTHKRRVAVFDFDGTLTRKDTFLEFIRFTQGRFRFWTGFIIHAPVLILMKLHIYANWKAKQQVFTFFFKGWDYTRFEKAGKAFSLVIDNMRKLQGMELLQQELKESNDVYVVSASIEEWLSPWCLSHGIKQVVSTQVEVKNGKLTGKFLTKNCYGKEKVARLIEVEPCRDDYVLYAYGDSQGDAEMLQFADFGIMVK